MRARELLSDLKARVAAADHEHRPVGYLIGPAVLGAVQLNDAPIQRVGDRRHARHLERAGGHHDLLGYVRAVAVGVDDVPVAVLGATDARARGC